MMIWRCPLCASDFTEQGNSLVCTNGHTFDRAKAGYINLHPVQFKKSKSPGDDKTMLKSRQAFHGFNSYQPLMKKLVDIIQSHTESSADLVIYDAGCGEGSYLRYCCDALSNDTRKVAGYGSDIAKVAVELAAKSHKSQSFVVASSAQLPVKDQQLDVALQVFSPGKFEEYHRVLTDDGLLITVDPAERHLWTLKSMVYDAPREHKVETHDTELFELIADTRSQFTLTLTGEDHTLALMQMTPYYWKLSETKRQTMLAELAQVECDFAIRVWKKR